MSLKFKQPLNSHKRKGKKRIVLLYTICYLHVISNSNLNYLLVYQLFGIILRLTRFPWITMMNFGMMIAGLKAFQYCREQLYLHIFWGICLFRYFFRASLRNIWCSPVGKQFLNIWKRGIIHVFFWHFPTRGSKFFPLFSSRRIELFVPLSNSFLWQLILRKLLFSWC